MTPISGDSATRSSRHWARWDLDRLRAEHPIEQVVAASGVELHARGRGYVGCCPFHDDTTPSLSVGGVAGRFHCFGCGASGDVIDYVSRLTGLPFADSVAALQAGGPFRRSGRAAAASIPTRVPVPVIPARAWSTTAERGYQVNQLAWEHFTAPAAAAHAHAWLRHHRGIDLDALRAETGGAPLAGYASPSRSSLTAHLRGLGVTDGELLDLDLAHQSLHGGSLTDTYRGRIILPVRDPEARICGFLGRDTTGHPAAPKYRNPTRTPTFDKAEAVYRPTWHRLDEVATVVIVEGALDALAIAAAAAHAGQSGRFGPVTTSGVTVSPAQADAILALHQQAPVIALDADPAGHDGTTRWLRLLSLTAGRLALVTSLPPGCDPDDWLGTRGADGLAAFERSHLFHEAPGEIHPHLPGRELVQTVLADRAAEPVPAVLAAVLPLAARLPAHAQDALLGSVEREMTAKGWNPHDQFTAALHRALPTTALDRDLPAEPPSPPAPTATASASIAPHDLPAAPSLT